MAYDKRHYKALCYFLLFTNLPKWMSPLYFALSAIKEANTSHKFFMNMLKNFIQSVPVLCTICKTEKCYRRQDGVK